MTDQLALIPPVEEPVDVDRMRRWRDFLQGSRP